MKHNIQSLIVDILKQMGVPDVVPVISVPEDAGHGDYSTNVAMQLAKVLKKSPMEIGLWVKEKLRTQISELKADDHNHNTSKQDQRDAGSISTMSVLQGIDHVEVVAPGFINIYLTEAMLITQVERVINYGEGYGTGTSSVIASDSEAISKNDLRDRHVPSGLAMTKKKIMVEFTDPNPFKEFHIGHLYSNSVGESLARLHEATGWEVKRADYFGDVGMHVAKALYGLLQISNLKSQILNLEKGSFSERVKFLGHAYAVGAKAYEDPSADGQKAKEEMKTINFLVFVSAQEYMVKTLGWKPVVDYKALIPQDALHDLESVKELFEKGRSWSMEYFESIFRRLGTTFDYYYPESIVGEYGAKLVREHIEDGTFTKSEGAVVFDGKAVGLHTRVFINSMGLPTYEAKELGLNNKKYQDYPFDFSIIVTGKEIDEYFKVLLSAMKKVIPIVAEKTRHIGHGMVCLPEGKMSSRTGNVVTGEGLIDVTKAQIQNYLLKSDRKYTKEVQEEIVEKAAIAAIKYSLLKVALPADITFDIVKSVSFDGDSGPYLQYTYARAKSVLRKSQNNAVNIQLSAVICQLNTEERALARLLLYFPDLVKEATAALSPNILCTYLFQLAQAFNLFYAKHQILAESAKGKVESSFRLALTAATAQVLKNGLYLLGIEVLEEM